MMLLPYITLLCITMPLSSTETTTTIISPTTHISNSTAVSSRYGEIPDITGIKFQYEDSREVGNTIWDNHVEKIIARGILQFALQMDYVLRESDKSHTYDNLVFSPVNIASALAMVMLGSAGKTFEEITTVLGLVSGVDISANSDEVHYHFGKLIRKLQAHPGEAMSTYIAMAGGVFVQEGYPVEVKFLHQIWEIYGSEILSLDFSRHSSEAKDVINIWVQNRTYGRIPDILDAPPPPSTKIIIGSALYFNGAWENPFPTEQTAWKPFYVDGTKEGEILQVIMMVTGADLPYYYDKELGCQIVGLPYKDHAATMYLILPDEAGLGALKQLKNRMTINHMHQLADLTVETTTIIAVPRMQLESTIHLKHALKMLGVHSLFTPSQADLSKISSYSPRPPTHNYQHSNVNSSHLHVPQTSHQSNAGQQKRPEEIEFRASDTNPGLYVEDIIHKVTVDITETGTEASAASVVSITRDGTHKVVRFERPFLFFIRHRTTGIVLFWGTVTKPVPNQSTYVKQ